MSFVSLVRFTKVNGNGKRVLDGRGGADHQRLLRGHTRCRDPICFLAKTLIAFSKDPYFSGMAFYCHDEEADGTDSATIDLA